MKKLPIIIFIVFSTSIFCKTKEEYKLKSGFIKYEISGYNKGFSEIYFDDYGRSESIYSETDLQVQDVEMKVKIGTIKKDGKLYTLNYISRTYFSENLPQEKIEYLEKTKEKSKSSIEKAFDELEEETEKIESEKKGHILGTETVLGKECQVLKVKNGLVWVYKGVVLRKILILNKDKIIYEAVKFEENPEIPTDKFKIPEGFMVVENPMNKLFKSSDN